MFKNLSIVIVTGAGEHGEFGPVQAKILTNRVNKDGGEVYVNSLPGNKKITHVITNRSMEFVNRLTITSSDVKIVTLKWFSESVTTGSLLPEGPYILPGKMEMNVCVSADKVATMPRKNKLTKMKIDSFEEIDKMIKLWRLKKDNYRMRVWMDVKNRVINSPDGVVYVSEGVRRCLTKEVVMGDI